MVLSLGNLDSPVILELYHVSNSPGGLVKMQIVAPHSQIGVGPENLQLPGIVLFWNYSENQWTRLDMNQKDFF